MKKSKSEKNCKYSLLKNEDDNESNMLETSFVSTQREVHHFKPFHLKKDMHTNYDTNETSDNECSTALEVNKTCRKQNSVINPLYDIDEYLHSDKSNVNNNNSKCTKALGKTKTFSNEDKKQQNTSHKRNSFLNILTRTIKDLVNKNQTHLEENNFIDKKTFPFGRHHNDNKDFLIDDVQMSLRGDDQVQLKVLMPRNCFDNADLELNKLDSRRKKSVKDLTCSKVGKGCGSGGGGGGRYVTSTSSDTDINRKEFISSYSQVKKNSKIKLNNHRLFSKQPNNKCQKIIHMNKSNSLVKLNKCLNEISSLSSSTSSCDLYNDGQKKNSRSRGCSNKKCLLFLCVISFFLNPLFGKKFFSYFKILISNG
jgi:hypothetical protein